MMSKSVAERLMEAGKMSPEEMNKVLKKKFPNMQTMKTPAPKGILYRYREDYRDRATAPIVNWTEETIRLAAWATVWDRKIDRAGDDLPDRCRSWSEETYHLVAKYLASFESKRVAEFDMMDMRFVAAVTRRLKGDER
jgi:hypothetical protein